ncbi:MAG: flavodoxin [Asgard group archaeon]|nr:flavodoxin [Asgard group archaeon]
MKVLVVYYSFEGDVKFIGDAIANELKADVLELKLEVEVESKDFMKSYLGEKQVLMKTEPKLKSYSLKPSNYDILIIGTPIWSGTYAPAIRTFLNTENFTDKLIGLFYCYTVKRGRISKYMTKALKGNSILSEIGFKDPLKGDKDLALQRTKKWIDKFKECLNKRDICLTDIEE